MAGGMVAIHVSDAERLEGQVLQRGCRGFSVGLKLLGCKPRDKEYSSASENSSTFIHDMLA
jgi:hypothetical protein